MNFLMVEDKPDTTEDTVSKLESQGHVVVVVTTLIAARDRLNTMRFHAVLLDQFIPLREGGPEASEEQVFEFARDIEDGRFDANPALYFLWVTAHEVEERRSEMPRCLATVRKAGGASDEVTRWLGTAIEGYYDDLPAEGARDQVLVEVWYDEGGALTVNVSAWRADENFVVSTEDLPNWTPAALRAAEGKPIYFKARANLRAERHPQLDLGDFNLLAESDIDEKELWDA